MKLVDIHTHKSTFKNGTICIKNILPEQIVETENKSQLFSTGIHPWYIENYKPEDFEKWREKIAAENILLIGECGLDKNIKTHFETQRFWFKKQIEVSEALQKPLIIHCVGYYNEIIALRKDLKPAQQWILHGFRGKPQLAEQAMNAGFDISFGEKFNEESLKITPLEHLFIETDESDLNIETIYESIASVKACQVSELTAGFNFINRHSVCCI